MSVETLDTSGTTDDVRPSTRWILAAVGALGIVVVVMAMNGFSNRPLAELDQLETMGRACVALTDSLDRSGGSACIEEKDGAYMFDGTLLEANTEVVIIDANGGTMTMSVDAAGELTVSGDASSAPRPPLSVTKAWYDGEDASVTVAYSANSAAWEE